MGKVEPGGSVESGQYCVSFLVAYVLLCLSGWLSWAIGLFVVSRASFVDPKRQRE